MSEGIPTNVEIGKRIYERSLGRRKGFRQDQLGIDDRLWDEIMSSLADEAIEVIDSIDWSAK